MTEDNSHIRVYNVEVERKARDIGWIANEKNEMWFWWQGDNGEYQWTSVFHENSPDISALLINGHNIRIVEPAIYELKIDA